MCVRGGGGGSPVLHSLDPARSPRGSFRVLIATSSGSSAVTEPLAPSTLVARAGSRCGPQDHKAPVPGVGGGLRPITPRLHKPPPSLGPHASVGQQRNCRWPLPQCSWWSSPQGPLGSARAPSTWDRLPLGSLTASSSLGPPALGKQRPFSSIGGLKGSRPLPPLPCGCCTRPRGKEQPSLSQLSPARLVVTGDQPPAQPEAPACGGLARERGSLGTVWGSRACAKGSSLAAPAPQRALPGQSPADGLWAPRLGQCLSSEPLRRGHSPQSP